MPKERRETFVFLGNLKLDGKNMYIKSKELIFVILVSAALISGCKTNEEKVVDAKKDAATAVNKANQDVIEANQDFDKEADRAMEPVVEAREEVVEARKELKQEEQVAIDKVFDARDELIEKQADAISDAKKAQATANEKIAEATK